MHQTVPAGFTILRCSIHKCKVRNSAQVVPSASMSVGRGIPNWLLTCPKNAPNICLPACAALTV